MNKLLLLFTGVFACIHLSLKADINDLKVTEIMYNPPDAAPYLGNDYEFIELKNTGTTAIDITSLSVVQGVQYTFGSGTLAGGDFLVIVSNATAFEAKYPSVQYHGTYTSGLSKNGEWLRIRNGADTIISIKYNDAAPWPVLADGHGYSIVPTTINPTYNQKDWFEWNNSVNLGGSPGADEPTANNFPDVLITELLSHTDLPYVDVIEINNRGASAADISGWWVSDNRNDPWKYQIPAGTILQPGAYLTIDEYEIVANALSPFKFNRSGDQIVIFSGTVGDTLLTGYAQGWTFGAEYNGHSFGTHTTSENELHFVAQSAQSLGADNAYPRVGSLTITRIMYNPNQSDEEYLTIKNVSDSIVRCYSDETPDTTWQVTGIGFSFPVGTTMQPDEIVILCRIDEALFRTHYNIPATTQVFRYNGKLSNGGETLKVLSTLRSDTLADLTVFVPWITMDKVDFSDQSPWPIQADGFGSYLMKTSDGLYGNDPASWSTYFGNPLGLEDYISQSQLSVYPNPMQDRCTFDIKGFEGSTEILILDLTGKEVFNARVTMPYSFNNTVLDAGTYIYQVADGQHQKYGKLLIN